MVPRALLADARVSDGAVRTYAALASFAGADRRAWPGVAALAELSTAHEGTVRRRLARLCVLGYLEAVEPGVRGRPTVWRLVAVDSAGEKPRAAARKPKAAQSATESRAIGDTRLLEDHEQSAREAVAGHFAAARGRLGR